MGFLKSSHRKSQLLTLGFFDPFYVILVPQLYLPDVVVEPVEHVVVEGDHVDRKAGGALLTEHAVAPHLPVSHSSHTL
jgi:hypothetical protein